MKWVDDGSLSYNGKTHNVSKKTIADSPEELKPGSLVGTCPLGGCEKEILECGR